jgi:hypothetical protein
LSEMCIRCTYKLIGGWGMNIFNDSDVRVEGWILESSGVICASLGVRGGRWYLMPKGGVGGRG